MRHAFSAVRRCLRAIHRRATCTRLLPLALAVAGLSTAQLAPAQIVSAPTAAPVDFPDASGRFEHGVTTVQVTPVWAPWTWAGLAGIAANGFVTAIPAPEGTHAAFLQGAGASAAVSFTFQPGIWRLRFFGAQATATDAQRIRVTIGATQVYEGMPVATGQYELLTTRAIRFAGATTATVTIAGLDANQTALFDRVELQPVGDWHAPATWQNGQAPSGTDQVTIQAGDVVALSGDCSADTVMVHGELTTVFESAYLHTRWVDVDGAAAALEVGQPGTPFLQEFELLLLGLSTDTPGRQGTKYLMAMAGGRIELHGKPTAVDAGNGRGRTWTKLAAPISATAGTLSIQLADPVSWQPGDEIVIAGSDLAQPGDQQFSPFNEQSEVRRIQSVAPNGLSVTLLPTGGPVYAHDGTAPTAFGNGTRSWMLDRRAEVGLLSHNVRVMGDSQSPAVLFGAHVMLMRMPGTNAGGVGRFSNVEFRRVGQRNVLGHYPVHWHMQLDHGKGQYLRHCSIRESYNRAVTVHGTEYVVVEGNVAYEHVGHGFFLEDGSERFNEFWHNLGLKTIKPPGMALLPSDNETNLFQNRTPATYWITNPQNTFVGNVAGGTQGTGFWFALSDAPSGLSATNSTAAAHFSGVRARFAPVIRFEDNVAHSCGSGLDVNDAVDPVTHATIPNVPWIPPAVQTFTGMTVYGCDVGLYCGSDVRFRDPVTASIPDEMVVFSECRLADNATSIAFAHGLVLADSLVVARANDSFPPLVTAAFLLYDGPAVIQSSHFDGFDGQAATFSNPIGAAMRHPNHRFSGMTFGPGPLPNVDMPDFTPPNDKANPILWGNVIFDMDGTFVGIPLSGGVSLIDNHPMLASMFDVATGHPQVLPGSARLFASPFRFAHLRIGHPLLLGGGTPPFTAIPPITFTRQLAMHGPQWFLHDYDSHAHRQIAVIVDAPGSARNVSYRLEWPPLPATGEITITLDDLHIGPAGKHLLLELVPLRNLPWSQVRIDIDGNPLQEFSTLALLEAAPTSGFFLDDDSTEAVWLRFVSTGRRHDVTIAW